MSEKQIVLPEKFRRLKSLISNGTQYINTGYIPTVKTGTYIDAKATVGGDNFTLASGPNSSTICYSAWRVPATTDNSAGYYWNGAWFNFGANYTGQRFQGTTNFYNDMDSRLYLFGQVYKSQAMVESTSTYSLPFFLFGACSSDGTTVNSPWKGHIYEAKITEGKKLVRHFVPVYDIEKAEGCMYELIERKAYYNLGSSPFVCEDYQTGELSSGIPSRFMRVGSLQSTRTQYIDTEYVPNNETGIYIHAKQIEEGDTIPMGCRNGSSTNTRFYVPRMAIGSSSGYGWGGWTSYATLDNPYDSKAYLNYKNDKKALLVPNRTTTTYSKTLSDLSFTTSKSIYMFCANVAGSASLMWGGTIYEAKITQGTDVVRYFVPVVDTLIGEACMYELVQGKAYYNKGTGTFSYDKIGTEITEVELPSRFTRLKSLISSGIQFIDTKYVPNNETGLYIDAQQTVKSDSVVMGCRNTNANESRYYAGRVSLGSTVGYGWGGWKGTSWYAGGRWQSYLNFKNDRLSSIIPSGYPIETAVLSDLTFTPSKSLYIFSANIDGVQSLKWGGHLYEAKISQGTNVVRHYVPAYDNELNVPCLYDIIQGEAYYNEGDGELGFEFMTSSDDIVDMESMPEQFERISHLQFTGTQYIDTEVLLNTGDYEVSIDYDVNGGDTNRKALLHGTNFGILPYYDTKEQCLVPKIDGTRWNGTFLHKDTVDTKINYVIKSGAITVNGSNYFVGQGSSFTLESTNNALDGGTYSIKLGAKRDGDSSERFKGNVYRLSISLNGKRVRDFIPVLDTIREEACLFDLVSKKAFYNIGTGSFETNPISENEIEIIAKLPLRFKKLRWLRSTGGQIIETSYVPTDSTGLYVKAAQIGTGDTSALACWESDTKYFSVSRVPCDSSVTTGYAWGSWYSWGSPDNGCSVHEAYTNFNNDRIAKVVIDGVTKHSTSGLATLSFTPTKSLWMFACNTNGAISRAWNGKIFEAKITEGTTLVRHFIPVFDTEKGEGCMYDIIQGKAYYNIGTGQFYYNDGNVKNIEIVAENKLPNGFKYVDYIISSGNEFIDTEYIPTNETGYFVKTQAYNTSGDSYIFGMNEASSLGDKTRLYFTALADVAWGWNNAGTFTNTAANLRQEIDCSFNYFNSRQVVARIDNTTDFTYDLPQLEFTPSHSIYLFGINMAGTLYGAARCKISKFIITEGAEVVRHFVPCVDNFGVACMFELIQKKVYYNKGFGNFSYPRPMENKPYSLPAGYTQCSYLQSNGTQWIETGVVPTIETGVYLKTQHLSNGDHYPFGAWTSSSCFFNAPRFNTSSKLATYAFGTDNQECFYYDKADDLVYTSTMNLYNDRRVNIISGDTIWRGVISVIPAATITRTMWLFSFNMDGATINATYGKFAGRIFRAKITQGDHLVHDFVPCLDNNNRPCMYDIVTQTPYYNQSGGEEFTYCIEHELPSDFSKLKYLESTGTQIIKTGIIPTNSTGIYVDAYHTKYNGDTDWSVIGLRNTDGDTYFTVGRVQRDTNGAGFGWGAFTTPGGNGNVRYEASLNFLNDRQSIITAPSFVQRINTLGTLAFTPTKDLYMFGMNNHDSAATIYSTYRIYRAKISEGSEIVRDWVPAMDNRNFKPCMYDLINNVAYYNDGEDEFLCNRDFEGPYKGFSGLGCIGNRLGSSYKNEE